jgi:hypothetical protein
MLLAVWTAGRRSLRFGELEKLMSEAGPKAKKAEMNSKFVQLEIRDDDSLMKACDLLHDARCDVSSAALDRNVGRWTALFQRECFEDPDLMQAEPRLFIFTKHAFPFVLSELSLCDVASCEIQDRAHIGTYMFNECRLNGRTYELFFCEDMKIILKFQDKPRGQLCDLNLLEEKGSFFTLRNPFKRTSRRTTGSSAP